MALTGQVEEIADFVVLPLGVICAGRQVLTWTGPAHSAGRPGPASAAHSPAGPPRRAIPPEWAVGNGGGRPAPMARGWTVDGADSPLTMAADLLRQAAQRADPRFPGPVGGMLEGGEGAGRLSRAGANCSAVHG